MVNKQEGVTSGGLQQTPRHRGFGERLDKHAADKAAAEQANSETVETGGSRGPVTNGGAQSPVSTGGAQSPVSNGGAERPVNTGGAQRPVSEDGIPGRESGHPPIIVNKKPKKPPQPGPTPVPVPPTEPPKPAKFPQYPTNGFILNNMRKPDVPAALMSSWPITEQGYNNLLNWSDQAGLVVLEKPGEKTDPTLMTPGRMAAAVKAFFASQGIIIDSSTPLTQEQCDLVSKQVGVDFSKMAGYSLYKASYWTCRLNVPANPNGVSPTPGAEQIPSISFPTSFNAGAISANHEAWGQKVSMLMSPDSFKAVLAVLDMDSHADLTPRDLERAFVLVRPEGEWGTVLTPGWAKNIYLKYGLDVSQFVNGSSEAYTAAKWAIYLNNTLATHPDDTGWTLNVDLEEVERNARIMAQLLPVPQTTIDNNH